MTAFQNSLALKIYNACNANYRFSVLNLNL